jgi:hypothetical protein
LRDYGIVAVTADDRIPPGAQRVIDWWKRGKTPAPGPAPKDPNEAKSAVNP